MSRAVAFGRPLKTQCVPGPDANAVPTDPANGLSSEDISLSISLPSGGEDDDRDEDGSELSSQERVRLEQVRSGIFKILSEDPAVETTDDDEGGVAARGDDVTDFRNVGEIDRTSRYVVSGGNEAGCIDVGDDEGTVFAEKHEFEVI